MKKSFGDVEIYFRSKHRCRGHPKLLKAILLQRTRIKNIIYEKKEI